MKTYKSLKHLEKRCIANNGKKVNIWNDDGIKVAGKIYRQMEYGNYYITFRNTGKLGRQPTYANRNPITEKDSFITIEYRLLENEVEHTNNIYQHILIRESY